VDIWRAERRK